MYLRVPTPDVSDIALEVLDIDRIEAHDRGVEADVGLSDGGAEIVRRRGGGMGGEVFFNSV